MSVRPEGYRDLHWVHFFLGIPNGIPIDFTVKLHLESSYHDLELWLQNELYLRNLLSLFHRLSRNKLILFLELVSSFFPKGSR